MSLELFAAGNKCGDDSGLCFTAFQGVMYRIFAKQIRILHTQSYKFGKQDHTTLLKQLHGLIILMKSPAQTEPTNKIRVGKL